MVLLFVDNMAIVGKNQIMLLMGIKGSYYEN
jgi:hypothetical protein